MITIDATPNSAIVLCTCGWRAVRSTRAAAWTAAATHEATCHPQDEHARTMARRWNVSE